MDEEFDRWRSEIDRRLDLRAEPRMGRISAFDPATHSVKVIVLPEGDFPLNPGDIDETGWIPLAPPCPGSGWGLYAPPAIGTQVQINHQEAHHGTPVAIVSVNDMDHMPPSVPSGEIWAVHKSGTVLKLTNDTNATFSVVGALVISAGTSATITVQGDATITASGDVNLIASQVNLGSIGGRAVARDGDPVSTGGVIQATSTKVFSG